MKIPSSQKGKLQRFPLFLASLLLTAVLSGCAPIPMTPGGEPFGEQTASEDRTARVYEAFAEKFRQEAQEDWDGFTISWTDMGDSCDVDVYRSEEYTLAYCERMHDGVYLWYDGWLYRRSGETVTYREMPWEELQTDRITAGLWRMLQEVLYQTPEEMTYKYIPLSNKSGHLLTVSYTRDENQTGDYAKLSVPLDSSRNYESVSFQWQDVGEPGKWENVSVTASFYPLAGSASLQAERKIWSFGYDCGLLERNVPAISAQDEDREGCRAVVAGMDLSALRAKAVQQEDLLFPEFPGQCLGTASPDGAQDSENTS